jgi:ribonuclease HI
MIKALEWLFSNNYNYNNTKIIVKGDSQLVIYQIKGKYKVKKMTRIASLYQLVMHLISKFKDIEFEWVPREQSFYKEVY